MSSPEFLPYGRHSIDDDDIQAVVDVLRGDWLTGGPVVDRFERALSRVTSSPYVVACANGTAALHLAVAALALKEGDWVIVPAVTFLATANAARYVGADVHFADVDPDTGLMTVETFARALDQASKAGRRVKAVLPVHLNGQVMDPAGVYSLAESHGIDVIEDACHSLGTKFQVDAGYVPVGAPRFAKMSVFSFHPVKTIAMGEGGAITTGNEDIARKLKLLRSHGMNRSESDIMYRDEGFDRFGVQNPWYYEMSDIGYNYRASDINCALGLSQLARIEIFARRRKELRELYETFLPEISPLVGMVRKVQNCRPAWHLAVSLIDFAELGIDRGQLMRRLLAQGIGTQVHYIPLNRQPYYRNRYRQDDLPGADRYYERCLSLPLFPEMKDGDPARVVECLQSALSSMRF